MATNSEPVILPLALNPDLLARQRLFVAQMSQWDTQERHSPSELAFGQPLSMAEEAAITS